MIRRVREFHREQCGGYRWCLGCDEEPVGIVTFAVSEWIWWSKPDKRPAAMGSEPTEDAAMRRVEHRTIAADMDRPAVLSVGEGK